MNHCLEHALYRVILCMVTLHYYPGKQYFHVMSLLFSTCILNSFVCRKPPNRYLFNHCRDCRLRWNAACRVPTSTGKPGKSQKKVPCMEKSWNLKKFEKSWKNHGKIMEFCEIICVSDCLFSGYW